MSPTSSFVPSFNSEKTIQILLIRKSDHSQPDDTINIQHKGEDTYHVYYHDGNWSESTRYHMTVLSGAELDQYIEGLFTLVARDRDAFERVQFNIPCYPAVLYSPRDLLRDDIRQSLTDMMSLLYSAERVGPTRTCPQTNTTGRYFDYDFSYNLPSSGLSVHY
jgi:hypothetical protein